MPQPPGFIQQGTPGQANTFGNGCSTDLATPGLNDFAWRHPVCQLVQNLPNHDASTSESGLPVTNQRVRHNILAKLNPPPIALTALQAAPQRSGDGCAPASAFGTGFHKHFHDSSMRRCFRDSRMFCRVCRVQRSLAKPCLMGVAVGWRGADFLCLQLSDL